MSKASILAGFKTDFQAGISTVKNTTIDDTGFLALPQGTTAQRVGIASTQGMIRYNTTGSDRTLKKNFEDWTEDTLTLFKNLKPQKFNFTIEDDGAAKTKGYIAQDLVDSFPEAYPKEVVSDKYMFNPSGMVPYLMKALQEEIAKREALEARVAALEG